jgi:hypothetical protein
MVSNNRSVKFHAVPQARHEAFELINVVFQDYPSCPQDNRVTRQKGRQA